jgi:hypothetical protein
MIPVSGEKMVGINIDEANYKMHFCKGQYFRINNPKKFNINHLIYPSPSKTDLGIHATPDLAGGLRLGPDAFYVDKINYDINENDKEKFFTSVRNFLPDLKIEDLSPDTAGIRPKLQSPTDNFKDFVIQNETKRGFDNFINLIGIESPGWTSCLAIAEEVKNIISKYMQEKYDGNLYRAHLIRYNNILRFLREYSFDLEQKGYMKAAKPYPLIKDEVLQSLCELPFTEFRVNPQGYEEYVFAFEDVLNRTDELSSE